jgi:hypothetical protein
MLGDRPDWRDPGAYALLHEADPSMLAWEWLRRDPRYRTVAHGRCGEAAADNPDAHRFGLHRLENPALSLPVARPMWRKHGHRLVIEASGEPGEPNDDSIRLTSLGNDVSLAIGPECHHWLISNGLHAIRIDVRTAEPPSALLLLHYRLSGIGSLPPRIAALERFLTYVKHRRFETIRASNRRQVLVLRTADALFAGASQREIAACLVDPDASQASWRSEQPSVRSRAQRLVRSARAMAGGGFWRLLQ